MSDEDPKSISDIQEKHLDTYRSNPDRIESDAGTERQDKAGYEGRFVFELLQNAVDEMDGIQNPRVAIELTGDKLIVANNGNEFTIEDLYALTLTTRTTKAGRTTIGHKGRGFTSVLNITDRPMVFSDSVQAKFDRPETCRKLNEDENIGTEGAEPNEVPMLQIPFSAEPSVESEKYLENGFTTVFEFPLKNPKKKKDGILRKLQQLGKNTVALLPELEVIEIESEGWERTWKIDRKKVDKDGNPTLVELESTTFSDTEKSSISESYLLFERTGIDSKRIAEQAALEETEIETMGDLSVGLAFDAKRNEENDDWILGPVHGSSPDEPPYVHVFLPTQEHSPVPALVTGTFQSDTSRRNLPLDFDDKRGYGNDFNALLFEEVGELFNESVIPFVQDSATTSRELISALDPSIGGRREHSFAKGTVDHCLFEKIKSEIRHTPFLPASRSEQLLSISETYVPYTSAEKPGLGREFTEIVSADLTSLQSHKARFVSKEILDHQAATTLRSLGGNSVEPADVPGFIGQVPTESIELDSAYISEEPDENEGKEREREKECTLYLDPVLILLTEIRKTLDSDEQRMNFDRNCQAESVFPTDTDYLGGKMVAVKREPDGEKPFFIPPEEPTGDDKLPGISFLPRELHHGIGDSPELAQRLRETELPQDFETELENIWNVSNFRFSDVFDAAIRPFIPGPNSQDVDPTELQSASILNTIHSMADVTSPENNRSPGDPLLYKSSRKPYFELCRLPVPAVPLGGGEVQWKPAHSVYFSDNWQQELGRDGQKRVEPLLRKVSEEIGGESERFEPWFLASTEWFEDEISEFQGNEKEWNEFFRWLGVAEHVRPLPLFSPDSRTRHRYKKTKGLSRPPRSTIESKENILDSYESGNPVDSRYLGLEDEQWNEYKQHLLEDIEPLIEKEEHRYISQINSLEYVEEIITAARRNREVGELFLKHLTEWWEDNLEKHQNATVVEFTNQRWRGSNQSYFFKFSERESVGKNLWLWKLRKEPWMPSELETEKYVEPQETWILSRNDRSRFSLRIGVSRPLLPFLEVSKTDPEELLSRAPGLYRVLDVGTSLNQESFEPDDAQRVLSRIPELFELSGEDISRYAGEVELIYSRLSELFPPLKGDEIDDEDWEQKLPELSETKVLCTTPEGYEFRHAREAYFVRSQRERELYGDLGLPIIALTKQEAPGFGLHIGASDTREAVTIETEDGEDMGYSIEIESAELDREWFETVLAALLVRLRVDRSGDEDTWDTRRFLERLHLVDGLRLELSTESEDAMVERAKQHQPYYIHHDGSNNEREVDIDATVTASEFIDALAQAYTDYMDIPHYEGAYNLIDEAFGKEDYLSGLSERLDIVRGGGSKERILKTRDTLFRDTIEEPDRSWEEEPEKKEDEDTGSSLRDVTIPTSDTNGDTGGHSPTPDRSERIPPVESLKKIGDREVIEVNGGSQNDGNSGGGSTGGGGGSTKPPSKEYRDRIDEFGMTVAMQSEQSRLKSESEEKITRKVWNVSTPEEYDEAKNDDLVSEAIDNSAEPEAFDTDWPGFDILTIRTNSNGDLVIDRCIELKSSGRKTRKPSLSWNEWKAASTKLSKNYYLYVVRNIKKGKSGDAALLEIPRPFQTLAKKKRERREREVQLDLSSFDFDEEALVKRRIEWRE